MTETTTSTDPSTQTEDFHPFNILMNVIVHMLTPIFLTASNGNIGFAQMAASETIKAYRARDQVDLLSIAQIIAYGLAALGSLSLSMTDDISLSMTLRLRGNANALSRSSEQSRRALKQDRVESIMPQQHEPTDAVEPTAGYEAAVLASVAEAQERVAETQAGLEREASAVEQMPIAAATAAAPVSDATLVQRQNSAVWAAGMAEVAAEFTASLPYLPPAERKKASMRAAALSSSASALMLGTTPPWLKSGDFAGIVPPSPS